MPRQQRSPDSPFIPTNPGAASGTNIIPQGANVPIRLDLLIDADERKQVGGGVTYNLNVRNMSNTFINHVAIEAEFDDALIFPGRPEKKVTQTLGRIAPRKSSKTALTLFSDKTGRHCCRFRVTVAGVEIFWKSICVDFEEQRLSLDVIGPKRRNVGGRAEYTVKLVNTSPERLTAVRARVFYDSALKPREGSAGAVRQPGNLDWVLGSLEPGEGVQLQVEFECQSRSRESYLRFEVSSDGLPTEQKRRYLKVFEPQGPLVLEVADHDDLLRVGNETYYLVTVRNQTRRPIGGVRLVARIASNLQLVSGDVRGGSRKLPIESKIEGGQISFPRIRTLLAGTALTYRINAKAVRRGEGRLQVRVTHSANQRPIEAIELTTVNP